MNAELISVGTEILLGQILNTNVQYLSKQLAALGVNVYYHTTVGDNSLRLKKALEIAVQRAELIITTGGLGPTGDDLTKEALAEFLALPLEILEPEVDKIKSYFKSRNLEWVDSNKKQAAFPPGSYILQNDRGTAPGMALKRDGCCFIVLPGPPKEMEEMFNRYTVPWLKRHFLPPDTQELHSLVLRFGGISESKLEDVLWDLLTAQSEPTLALLAREKEKEIHLRITAHAKDREEFLRSVGPVFSEIKKRTKGFYLTTTEETLPEVVSRLLKEKKLTVSTAESCTGGLLSSQITALPGSSEVYLGSVISYSNECKEKILGVPAGMLEEHGAVSAEVAEQMALGVRKLTGSDIGISITGIAGPDGGTPFKPVGLVFIAIANAEGVKRHKYVFNGDRETIRYRSAAEAMQLLHRMIRQQAL